MIKYFMEGNYHCFLVMFCSFSFPSNRSSFSFSTKTLKVFLSSRRDFIYSALLVLFASFCIALHLYYHVTRYKSRLFCNIYQIFSRGSVCCIIICLICLSSIALMKSALFLMYPSGILSRYVTASGIIPSCIILSNVCTFKSSLQ